MSLLTTASLVVTPNAYKEGKLYSVIPSDGSGDMSVVRATSATRVNSEGLIEVVSLLGNELVTNGDFATDTSWAKSANTTISGGQAIFTANGAIQYLIQANAWVADSLSGKKVQLTYTIISNSLNAGLFRLGGVTGASAFNTNTLNASVGTYTVILDVRTSAGTDNAIDFYITPTATSGTLVIDNVSIKEVITNNIPRIDYSLGGCPNILLEPQRTNIALQSSSFDSATWTKSALTVTANNAISPSGVQDADLVTANGATSQHYVLQTVTAGAKTYSVFAKMGTQRYIQILTSGTAAPVANFDLQDGVANMVGSNSTASIEDFGNGWYRCILQTNDSLAENFYINYVNSLVAGRFQSILSSDTLYLWGAQAEVGSYATSYIPTTTASVTRNADVCVKTGISSLIGQTEGTIYLEADIQKHNDSEFYIAISNGSSLGEAIYLYQPSSGALNILFRTSGLTTTIAVSSANWNIGFNKIAIAYNSTSGEVFINGASKGTVALPALPTCSKLTLGSRPDAPGSLVGSGGYKVATLWKERLTDDQLAQLTTI